MSEPAARRGRRRGAPDTRAAILAAARERFATAGFAASSVRAIASDAGVDSALVHHYFGTKQDLFVAALQLPVDPRGVLAAVVAGGLDGAGERLLGAVLGVWDQPENRLPLLALARSVLDGGGHLLTEGFLPVVIAPALAGLGVDQVERRAPLVATQLVGVIVLRYVAGLEPLASMPASQLVATVGPTLQRYLTEPLP